MVCRVLEEGATWGELPTAGLVTAAWVVRPRPRAPPWASAEMMMHGITTEDGPVDVG